MYLSQLILNDRNPRVRRHLSNIHDLHRGVMQAFPDEQREQARADWNVLFRLEPDSNILLVQSAIEPDWTQLPNEYLIDRHSKPFTPEVSHFPIDRQFQFRLKANPSKRNKETRKTVGIYFQPDQVAWLQNQGKRHGFSVESIDTIPSPNLWGKKDKNRVEEDGSANTTPTRLGKKDQHHIKVHTVLFQGILKVQDPSLLVSAIQQGIGRGKSYGCGLLSLSRINRS
jgi:CRISPR system Cascade subunit CasE